MKHCKENFKFITSWDDYCLENIKLAEVLKKYNLPAIFFIELSKKEAKEQIKYLSDLGFEIGSHTINHPQDLKKLALEGNFEKLYYEIDDSKKILELLTEKTIEWFCYPRGRYNDVIKDVVETFGYKYARTTKVLNIEHPDDLYEIETSIHVYPNRKEYGGKKWIDIAFKLFDEAYKNNGYFHLWGHAWEIEKFGLWDELEWFLKYVKSTFFANGIE